MGRASRLATLGERGRAALVMLASFAAGALAVALLPLGATRPGSAVADLGGPLAGDPTELDDGHHHVIVSFDDGRAEPAQRGSAGGGSADAVRLVGVAAGDPHVAALGAVPGTSEIEAVGGGWYAVTTDADPAAYQQLPGVAAALPDVVLGVFEDPLVAQQWHLRNTGTTVAGIAGVPGADIGADEAWAAATGTGVVVAVVDTGMEITHPDLAGSIWANDDDCGDRVDDDHNGYVDDCHGWDFLNDDGKVDDTGLNAWGRTIDNTHATHVGGIVAAGLNNGVGGAGVAPGARLMPLKISDASSMSMATAATAIRYAVDNGADIINCSFGTSAGTPLSAVAPMQDAVRYAEQHGVLVVAAAGNDGRDIDAVPTYPASFPEPNLITVGASTNADTRASFSNWGAASVDLFAPGWSVVSTLPGGTYGSLHGTSMASPVVAGAAAVVMQAQPGLDASGVKAALLTGSTPSGAFAGISVSGQRLDLGRIVNPSGTLRGEPVSFTFSGFGSAAAGEPASASIGATVVADAVPAGARVGYRATLLTNVAGAVYGVSGAELTTDLGPAVTDDAASVLLSPLEGHAAADASRTLGFGHSLPAGEYALVLEADSTADGSLLGRMWAVFFSVVEPGQAPPPPVIAPVPTTLPAGTGGGTTPTTQWPWPTPPAPGWGPGGTTPTTQWSWGGTTPTTQWSWPTPPAPGWGPGGTTPTTQWSWPTPPAPDWGPGGTTPTTQWSWPAPPPTGSGPGGTTPTITLPPAPSPVSSGGLTVTSVSPRQGTTDGGTRVRIDGNGFSSPMHVRFGVTAGTDVLVISPTALLVTAPAHAAAATVDVRVATATNAVVLPSAYTYVPPGSAIGAPAPGSPSPSPGGAPPSPGGGPTPTSAPAPTTTQPAGGDPVPPADQPGGSQPPAGTLRFTFGAVSASRGSLQLRPLVGPSPLDAYPPATWPLRRCSTTTCAGTKL